MANGPSFFNNNKLSGSYEYYYKNGNFIMSVFDEY